MVPHKVQATSDESDPLIEWHLCPDEEEGRLRLLRPPPDQRNIPQSELDEEYLKPRINLGGREWYPYDPFHKL